MTTFPALKECEGKITQKRDALGKIFSEAGPEMDLSRVKAVSGSTHEIAGEIRKLNDELSDLTKERENLLAVQKASEAHKVAGDNRESGDGAQPPAAQPKGGQKSFGQLFVESDAYKLKAGSVGPEAKLDINVKALFETTNGWEPEVTRSGRMVDYVTRPIQVAELLPSVPTGQAAVSWMEETTFTNAAAEVAEGGAYAEATLELAERSTPVRKISVYLSITDEQLEDEARVQGYVDNRLPFMIRQRLDSQILNGDGLAPNLEGILTKSGIQTQAKGADPTPDAVYKAMTKVRVTGQGIPSATVMNPADWQNIRLLRTADGIYIWGNPSDAGPERMWGLQVAQAEALAAGTALVGDFANFSELAVRRGVDVQVSNSHSDYFIKGKQALRADIRVALVVYRPAAFCQVTGLS
jgi:HK97 family phage major capsid protein